ncbi:radiation-inducible immediate-early gene IEX-1 [Myotis yumanensis]|uniref:radiation-inducible immediate-early gene IEX-1 n=1 Tax=Myotis yumanensis TaxID=159337 RepID=UPI0038D0087B
MCRSRCSLPTMTVLRAPTPAPSASPGPRRGSGPEVFTFDPLPEPAAAPASRPSASRPCASRGHRKRSRRVLYPRVVRRQLPAEDASPARRLLFLLLAVVFCQVLTAEEGVPEPRTAEDAPEPAPAPPAREPRNVTAEPADRALDLRAFLPRPPAAL